MYQASKISENNGLKPRLASPGGSRLQSQRALKTPGPFCWDWNENLCKDLLELCTGIFKLEAIINQLRKSGHIKNSEFPIL